MKYKMIVSDFDGTISNWDGSVPKENIQAIKDYIACGGKFCISSGRMMQSVKRQVAKMGLQEYDIPLMSFQGSMISLAGSDEAIYSVSMNREVVKKVVKFAYDKGYYCHYYGFENFYVHERNKVNEDYCTFADIHDFMRPVGDLLNYLDDNPDLAICKILFITGKDDIDKVEKEVTDFMQGEVEFNQSASILIECVDKCSGKGSAIEWYAKQNGIDIKEVIGVGDSMNDYSLIKSCGLGVAMGNACSKIKEIADYVTLKNSEAGLADLIYKAMGNKL